jgi:molecular chaperone DnaK (HSP70)
MNQHSPATDDALPPRYVVGIDLGTTNCAVAFVDSQSNPWKVETFSIEQWVDWGQIERRTTLPSFHYQLTDQTRQSLAGGLSWQTAPPDHVVGFLARDAGMRQPGRRISSAKSWLSHDGVDRTANLLPWHGDDGVPMMSPVDAAARYLQHIRHAWDSDHPDELLGDCDVIVTLPASFDEVARELTVAAARKAGLPRIYLIEEPQSAFYAWIDRHRDDWHQAVGAGDLILVCDIGGGTSDFTLIRVRPAGGGNSRGDTDRDTDRQVQFHRVAVGQHLILGGDNLDLALARFVESRINPDGSLPPRDWDRLIQACRTVKETMLRDDSPDQYSINLAGEGARLIGGSITASVSAQDIQTVLVEGFFPRVPRDARPESGQSGFREFGLPYADDPAITRHLAHFLAQHCRAGLEDSDTEGATSPRLILFNGGVMASPRLRDRIVESVCQWFEMDENPPQVLDADRLDMAVAQGAAYYGMVRRGQGVRIAANLARSYYMQVSPEPPETMCLIPGSAETAQTFAPDHPLRLELGTPVQFPLWVSSTRLADAAGDLIPIEAAEMSPLPPIRTVLTRGRKRGQQTIDVRIETELSEIGTLGLFAVDVATGQRWRLEFDIRSTLETDRQVHTGTGESFGIVDSETIDGCVDAVRSTFAPSSAADALAPSKVMRRLRAAVGVDRSQWPPSLLRDLWQSLMDVEKGRRRSAAHESRWLNLVGYCLRPGYGMAVDDWRVAEVWRTIHGKLAFPAPATRTESLILWRRIAGGLTAGQQQQLLAPLMSTLVARGGRIEPHEAQELWRMVGSLEWLSQDQKVTLANAAMDDAGRSASDGYRVAILWAVGRLISRQPLYGPLNTVVAPRHAEQLIDTMLRSSHRADATELAMRQLSVAQMAARTTDRYRDISDGVRQEILDWLSTTNAPERYGKIVAEGGRMAGEDDAAIFGESLPLGIRLAR